MSSSSDLSLRWSGEGLIFHGGVDGGPQVTLDSGAVEGLSPTQYLLLSLAGCMGIDVQMILEKSRVPLRSLEVRVDGDRAETEPRKFEVIRLTYLLSGPEEEHQAKVDRAIQLSRDKYCSVLHTLNPAIDIRISVERV
jgi:putative redox protein